MILSERDVSLFLHDYFDFNLMALSGSCTVARKHSEDPSNHYDIVRIEGRARLSSGSTLLQRMVDSPLHFSRLTKVQLTLSDARYIPSLFLPTQFDHFLVGTCDTTVPAHPLTQLHDSL
jgi:hypothetical protein